MHCVSRHKQPSLNSRDLHSRTSGVSSGATSGSGSGSNVSYWHHPASALAPPSSAALVQRKYPTLSRPSGQQKVKSNPILRTRSFQVHPNLSQFSPSEHSAFHCISANNNSKELSQVNNTYQSIKIKNDFWNSFRHLALWPQRQWRAGSVKMLECGVDELSTARMCSLLLQVITTGCYTISVLNYGQGTVNKVSTSSKHIYCGHCTHTTAQCHLNLKKQYLCCVEL